DAMFRSILERSDDGFEFAHSVFEEYFVARALNKTELLSWAGFLAIGSHDVSSSFGLAAYDHFLREKIDHPDSTLIKERYGMKWCRISPGVIIFRNADSSSRELRRLGVS